MRCRPASGAFNIFDCYPGFASLHPGLYAVTQPSGAGALGFSPAPLSTVFRPWQICFDASPKVYAFQRRSEGRRGREILAGREKPKVPRRNAYTFLIQKVNWGPVLVTKMPTEKIITGRDSQCCIDSNVSSRVPSREHMQHLYPKSELEPNIVLAMPSLAGTPQCLS